MVEKIKKLTMICQKWMRYRYENNLAFSEETEAHLDKKPNIIFINTSLIHMQNDFHPS